jgi:hypothetical protein
MNLASEHAQVQREKEKKLELKAISIEGSLNGFSV